MRRLPLKMLPVVAAINAVLANPILADTTDGLVAYYPFNGNANDETGNGNNGTVNGATLAADMFGNANSAYGFNGTNQYIGITNTAFLPLNNATRSMFGWVKTIGVRDSLHSTFKQ